MRVFDGLDALQAAVGEHLGFGGWHEVTQERVQAFADATGDHQWIHLDVARAAAGPFGGTVAHGYLTLSLIPLLGRDLYSFSGFQAGVNYGLNKVRFPVAVKVGSSVRMGSEVLEVNPVKQGVRAVFRQTVEVRGESKPGCVADAVVLLVP